MHAHDTPSTHSQGTQNAQQRHGICLRGYVSGTLPASLCRRSDSRRCFPRCNASGGGTPGGGRAFGAVPVSVAVAVAGAVGVAVGTTGGCGAVDGPGDAPCTAVMRGEGCTRARAPGADTTRRDTSAGAGQPRHGNLREKVASTWARGSSSMDMGLAEMRRYIIVAHTVTTTLQPVRTRPRRGRNADKQQRCCDGGMAHKRAIKCSGQEQGRSDVTQPVSLRHEATTTTIEPTTTAGRVCV